MDQQAASRFAQAVAAVRGLPPRAALAREMRAIRRAEIAGSTILSGGSLDAGEIDALLDRGIAAGGHPFVDYVLVRGYADAADWVASQRVAERSGRPLLALDELRQLHARVVAGSTIRGGAWRLRNPPPRAQVVPPAAWLVPREMAGLVDRAGRGPGDEPVPLWLARFLGRFARIRPFEAANGRTGRLAVALLLRRLELPPAAFERPDRARFPRALAAAERREPEPLAALIATAVIRACNRLSAVAAEDGDTPEPLRALAGDAYPALARAAHRGRLRTIVRGGRYLTTRAWIAEYRATASAQRDTRPEESGA